MAHLEDSQVTLRWFLCEHMEAGITDIIEAFSYSDAKVRFQKKHGVRAQRIYMRLKMEVPL